jgi:hypothetical protein
MQRARDDIRMVQLRDHMLHAIQGAVELWSTDAGISEVRLAVFEGTRFPYACVMIPCETIIGSQRPLQIDHGPLRGCHTTLITTGTFARARMRRGAAPANCRLACACKHAHYTAKSHFVNRAAARTPFPGGARHYP